jgi:glutathione S-transferase
MRTVREKNPLGKIPLLVLEDGTALPESQIIVEYLEERFADRGASLVPEDTAQRARARLVARVHDVYMGSHFLPVLFRTLSEEQTSIGLRWIETALDMLEGEHPGGERFFVGDTVSIADVALAPTIVYMLEGNGEVGARLGGGEGPFYERPNLKAWWKCMMRDTTWLRVYEEMATMFPRNNPEAHMFSGQV